MFRNILLLSLGVVAIKVYLTRDLSILHLFRDILIVYTCGLILTGLYYLCIHRWLVSPLRKLPYPNDSSFFLGSAKRFLTEPFGVPNLEWQKNAPDGLYRIFLGPLTALIPTSQDALVSILGKNNVCVKPEQVRAGLTTLIGNGLVTSEGEEHKRQRKLLNPVFRGQRGVRTMVPSFWSKALRMQSEMQDILSQGPDKSATVDVSDWMMKVTFSMIMDTILCIDVEKDPEREDILLKAWKTALLHGEKQSLIEAFCEGVLPMFIPPTYTDWLLRHTKRNQRSLAGRQFIRQSILDQIQFCKLKEKMDITMNGTGKANLVDMMLDGGMSDETELLGQLLTMLAAGHETTAAALTWALFELTVNPDIQSRLREEIMKYTNDGSSDLTADNMDEMEYLHGFVMEVLRLWPSIHQTVRETTEDTIIENTHIPKGQMILIPIYAINRSERFWGEDAQLLRPERWTGMGTTAGGNNQYAFMTFLNGSRMCIGKEYSIRSMKAVLVALLMSFRFHEMTPGYVPKMRKDVTCQPQDGMRILLTAL